MAIENLSGSLIMSKGDDNSPPEKALAQHDHGRVRNITDKVEMGAAASVTSTYRLGRIRSNEVISIDSKLYWDDLTGAGAPTLDVGLEGDQITNDPNALADGLDVTAAGSSIVGPVGIADIGKMAWEYVSGQTIDPGGSFDIVVTLMDAAADAGGTIALEMKVSQA